MADVPDWLNEFFGDRFRFESELGRGAHAVVYLLWDVKNKRYVAAKVLQPELALAVRTERFAREMAISARLSHPHILPLLDSVQAGRLVCYLMPYVEGGSLRDRLKRDRQLPLEDALRITRDVAGALDHAHSKGIVHRDIKPENILFHADHAVVADFGIARVLDVAQEESVTHPGVSPGTPGYMSPEQAAGDTVDQRSDIYALGCVLYEMLAGRPPFTGATAQEVNARTQIDPVPSLRAARNAVPPAIEQAVLKALAKQPADRFATAGEMAEALTMPAPVPEPAPIGGRLWLVAAAVVVLVLAGVVLLARQGWAGWTSSKALADERSLGVLICNNLTVDTATAYFGEGMTEELIDQLQRIPGLRVPAFSSSLAIKRGNLSIRQLADTLGVANLVECSVRSAGGRVRIGARIIHAADESVLWAQSFDRSFDMQEFIGVQEEIARAITSALPVKLSVPSGWFLPSAGITDTTTYDLYLKGKYLVNQHTPEATVQAIEHYEEAIRRSPRFALAYSALAAAYIGAGNTAYMVRNVAYPKGREAAERALELDSGLANAHFSLGRVYFSADWNWAAAEREFRSAIRLNPNLADAHASYAQLHAVLGRRDSAAGEAILARRLDPLSNSVFMGNALMVARRYDAAIQELTLVIRQDTSYRTGYTQLARAYLTAGRFGEAIPIIEKGLAMPGGPGGPLLGIQAYAYARSGRLGRATEILETLKTQASSRKLNDALAFAYLGLRDRDRAVGSVMAAVLNREVNPIFVVDPIWDEIRPDPRFRSLLQSLGLANQ